MLVKVCGMRDPHNIRQTEALGIDWIGHIFYPRSPRFVGEDFKIPAFSARVAKRVGVFVNASPEWMGEAAIRHQLDYLQLHGHESADLCHTLQKRGLALIKAFAISTQNDLEHVAEYEGRVNYFLFDTKCEGHGGSGRQFDWDILAHYQGNTPFLLSGGIRPDSVEAILRFRHPLLAGVDLNSGFERSPGLKDIEALRVFINKLKSNNL